MVALGLCMTCALSLECCNEGTCGWNGGQVNAFRSFCLAPCSQLHTKQE